ncbi:Leucine_rich repeat protein [Hexamita inflata]|uniref:Leucine rich repeat protein n=1 Tax=Hexamita inflata TaxID=28002 RepID=A0AA86NQ73_9EUKA|nr:Leucine rich repeat protein [Hexamita inflata]
MTLSAALIYQKTKQSQVEQVKNLNIWGANLDDISILRQCAAVETLSLSVNNITTLEDLQGLNSLKELYLRKNKIADLRQVMYLANLPNLQVLWLSDNPVDQDPQYRLYVIKALPNLTRLDEKDVGQDERVAAQKTRFAIPHIPPQNDNYQPEPPVQQVVKPNYPVNVPVEQKPVKPVYQPVEIQAPPKQAYEPPKQVYQEPVQYAQRVQEYQPPRQEVHSQRASQPINENSTSNRKIVLAVLNLIDGLDVESLDTIKRQVNALIAAQK